MLICSDYILLSTNDIFHNVDLTVDSFKSQKQAPEAYIKKAFLKISQNSHKKHLGRSLFFNEVAGLR